MGNKTLWAMLIFAIVVIGGAFIGAKWLNKVTDERKAEMIQKRDKELEPLKQQLNIN